MDTNTDTPQSSTFRASKPPQTLKDIITRFSVVTSLQPHKGKPRLNRCHRLCRALDNLTAAERNLHAATRQLMTLKRTPSVGSWLYAGGTRLLERHQKMIAAEIRQTVRLLRENLPNGWVLTGLPTESARATSALVQRAESLTVAVVSSEQEATHLISYDTESRQIGSDEITE